MCLYRWPRRECEVDKRERIKRKEVLASEREVSLATWQVCLTGWETVDPVDRSKESSGWVAWETYTSDTDGGKWVWEA